MDSKTNDKIQTLSEAVPESKVIIEKSRGDTSKQDTIENVS